MIFWLLIGLVAFAPFPFASVPPWSSGLMACAVAGLLIAWSMKLVSGTARPEVGFRETRVFLVPFGLAAAWAAIQAMPMAPDTLDHPLWIGAGAALGANLRGTVSLDPSATGSALALLLAYGGIFWLSLQYCRSRQRARQVFLALTVAGLGYAAYGLVVEFSGAHMVLWFEKSAYVNNLTSTFINRNSYATYAGLTLLCAIAMFIELFSGAVGDHLSGRERIRSTLDVATGRGWMTLVACPVIATALLLSESRGGFLSTSVGIVALVIAIGATRTVGFRHAFAMAVAVFGIGLVFFLFSGEVTAERLARTDVGSEERTAIYDLTLQAIGDAPLLGTGLGTFGEVFRMYRDERVLHVFDAAHNTYLEIALELGLPAASLLVLSIAALFVRCVIGVRTRRRDALFPCIGVAATALIAVHSLVDFSMQIPAVAAAYALLMGAAVAQSWSSRQRPPHPAPERP